MPLWSAFMLGLLGSLHCAGMCGPLVFALHRGGGTMMGKLAYHSGRVLTYAVLGAVLGLLGLAAQMAGWQKTFSFLLGMILVGSVLLPALSTWLKLRFLPSQSTSWLSGRVNKMIGGILKSKLPNKQFYLGLLNGLLPCGMVYVAIAGALSLSDYFQSSLYMILFGLGTWPMLLAISLGSKWSPKIAWLNVKRLTPAFTLFLGLLLMWRGLSLQIELVSAGDPFAGITICRMP